MKPLMPPAGSVRANTLSASPRVALLISHLRPYSFQPGSARVSLDSTSLPCSSSVSASAAEPPRRSRRAIRSRCAALPASQTRRDGRGEIAPRHAALEREGLVESRQLAAVRGRHHPGGIPQIGQPRDQRLGKFLALVETDRLGEIGRTEERFECERVHQKSPGTKRCGTSRE